MELMRTTCLISNYNYARFVGEAVDGALRQTNPFDEIIVVDDGSTDDSLAALESNYGGHPSVQIIGKANEGQLSSFNAGFARATGDIVFFLDADDIYEPEYVEQALDVYHRNPSCDFLSCGRRFFGQQEGLQLTYPTDRDLGCSVIHTAYARAWIGAPTSCLSIRHHILDKILPLPFVDEWRVRADDCLVFGASLAGARKRYLAQPLVRYRVHEANHYQGQKPDRLASYRRRLAINRLFEYFERELCYNVARLADFPHREFRTIETPTFGQLMSYARISLGARVSLFRQLACIAEIFRHFLGSAWRSAPPPNNERAASTNQLRNPSLRLVTSDNTISGLDTDRAARPRLRAA